MKLGGTISNHNGTCISNPQNFSNKIFDCGGYEIKGNKSIYGIYLNRKSNNEIKNCTIKNYTYGIYLNNSGNILLGNNKFKYNSIGIYSDNSSSTIESNVVCYNYDYDLFSTNNWSLGRGDSNTGYKHNGGKDTCVFSGCSKSCEMICFDKGGGGFNGTRVECPVGTDCDDDNNLTCTGAPEICNGKDDNCNNQIDESPLCFCNRSHDGIFNIRIYKNSSSFCNVLQNFYQFKDFFILDAVVIAEFFILANSFFEFEYARFFYRPLSEFDYSCLS